MAERASMPTFVPRTVASFERAATVVARRVAAPVRMLATRALSFADRLMGSWAGAGPTTVVGLDGGVRPPMRMAARSGVLPMPRPWYEVAADEDVIWPQQAATRAPDATPAADRGGANAAIAATVATEVASAAAERVTAAAERGAAIAKTNLTVLPEAAAREAARPVGTTNVAAPATTGTTPATTAAPSAQTGAASSTAATTSAATTNAGAASGGTQSSGATTTDATTADAIAAAAATPGARDATSGARETREAAVADVRAAEALGLHRPMAPATLTVAPVARATTPLARALAHAAWVDAQLRTVSAAAAAGTARATTTPYVFVAPAEAAATVRSATEAAPAERGVRVAPLIATPAGAATTTTTTMTAPASVPPVAAWSARLPDPRLPETLPTTVTQRVAAFVAQLVGVEAARDVAPLPVVSVGGAEAPVERTVPSLARVAPAATYVALPAVSWRPGATAARVEQLGMHVDARVTAAWGEPTMTTLAATAPASMARASMVPAPAVSASTGGAALTTPAMVPERVRAVAARAGAPTLQAGSPIAASEMTYVAPAMARATGPARVAAFVQQLVGVQAARATSPLPVQALVAAAANEARTPAAQSQGLSAASARAPERVALSASTTSTATAAGVGEHATVEVLAVGGLARRAEQLGGVVGVRAAGLSIDFVDPARLSRMTADVSAQPMVAPVANDTIMPAPQPLFARPAPVAPMLSAEEWSLVATFPSAATAVQLAAARQAQEWSGAAPSQMTTTLASAGGGARTPTRATRGATPSVYVAPGAGATAASRAVAPIETESRLPSGRVPRGGFIWPKLADPMPARAEWITPAAIAVAEQASQAAPGMPLWGAMTPLETLAPALAASAGLTTTKETIARPTAGAPGVAARGVAPGGALPVGVVPVGVVPVGVLTVGGLTVGSTAGSTTVDARGGAPASTSSDAPAMTLMTAAATREARAAAKLGGREEDGGSSEGFARAPSAMPLASGGEAARGGATVGVSNVRPRAAMPLMTGAPARDGAANGATPSGATGPSARALELARPFLQMVQGGLSGGENAARASSAPRFYDQPQPVVAGAPSSDATARLVEALRSQPAGSSSDDRVSLADLTLIAIASATQQVAASSVGGGPSSSSAAEPSSSSSPGGGGGGGGGKSADPEQEIEDLARAAFEALKRLEAVERERSGDHG